MDERAPDLGFPVASHFTYDLMGPYIGKNDMLNFWICVTGSSEPSVTKGVVGLKLWRVGLECGGLGESLTLSCFTKCSILHQLRC